MQLSERTIQKVGEEDVAQVVIGGASTCVGTNVFLKRGSVHIF